jgi:rod shape-determining protein MreC
VLAITLMTLDKRVATVSHARATLSVILMPLQYIVSAPVQFIDKLGNTVSSHDALVRDNVRLKAQQLLLKAQVQRLLAIETENNQLKALMRSSAEVQGKVLIAQLLSVDTDPFVRQVILDKGTHDGAFIGQPVLDANGVMGKIIHAGPLTSRVLLVNDPHSGVPTQDARNGVRAIAMGDNYTGKLRLVNVPQTADIKVGDMLVTSGLGQHYPEGYPLGKVFSVIKDPGLQFATIIVDPSARLDRARQVLLVWPNRLVQPKKVVQQPGDVKSNG